MATARKLAPITRQNLIHKMKFTGVPENFPADSGHDALGRRESWHTFGVSLSDGRLHPWRGGSDARAVKFEFLTALPEAIWAGRRLMTRLRARAEKLQARGRHSEAFEVWRRAAELGDVEAEYRIGRIYQSGQGVVRSPVDALNGSAAPRSAAILTPSSNLACFFSTAIRQRGVDMAATWFHAASRRTRLRREAT